MNGITMDQWLKMVPDSVVNLPEGLRNLLFQLYQTFIAADRWKWFLNGLKITFAVTIGALILGVIIGLLIAIVRTAHDSRRMGKSNIILSILNAVCKLYLTVIRPPRTISATYAPELMPSVTIPHTRRAVSSLGTMITKPMISS